MASNLDALQNLPEIDFLSDLNITQETIAEEMLEDYQSKYEELTGKEITLYPANTERLKMQIVAGEIYQIYEYISYLFSQNFIQYMDREVLENWGATLGYAETNIKAATCILQFSVNDVLILMLKYLPGQGPLPVMMFILLLMKAAYYKRESPL